MSAAKEVVMNELTEADLARCRAHLVELPGFDQQGLWIGHASFGGEYAIATQPARATYADAWVSTTHVSTRDRLARWVAGRLGFTVIWPRFDPTRFERLPQDRGWWVYGPEGDRFFQASALGLDPDDPRLLPDGSPLVDAVALVEVAKYLGREVTHG